MTKINNPIYVSTACLPPGVTVKSRVLQYIACDLQNIELGANVEVNSDLGFLSNYQAQFLVHNYFPPPQDPFVLNLASKDENIRKRSIELVLNAIDLSSKIGAPFYSVHAGFITDPTSFGETSFIFPSPESRTAIKDSWSNFISSLDIVLEYSRKVGVDLLLENNVCSPDLVDKVMLVKPEEFQMLLLNKVSHPNLGILLDTGHLSVSAQTLGFNKFRFIDQITPYIKAIHIHDNSGKADTHDKVVEGSWVLDVLTDPNFIAATKVIESKFNNIKEIKQYKNWLTTKIC